MGMTVILTGVSKAAISQAGAQASHHADGAADGRHHQRLDQELLQDVALARTGGHADADFAGTLGYRHQHDVHHADAAHQQRDGRNGTQQQRHGVLRFFGGGDDGRHIADLEIHLAVALGQQLLYRGLGFIDTRHILHRHVHIAQAACARDAQVVGGGTAR